jgi:hypothetical protein
MRARREIREWREGRRREIERGDEYAGGKKGKVDNAEKLDDVKVSEGSDAGDCKCLKHRVQEGERSRSSSIFLYRVL